ncbi:hypothetical protein ACWCV9_06580 [Streptomyces sp. NPDC001606]
MTRKLRLRAARLLAAAVTLAAGTGCAARALTAPAAADRPVTSECGNGGAGGQGGDSGANGRPGKPGKPGSPGTHACNRYADLPDKPKGDLTLADKVRVVLVLLNGGATEAQIAHKYRMSPHEVETWKRAYLDDDWSVLMRHT